MPDLFPPDWEWVPLARILSFSNGVNAQKSAYGAGIPFANVLEVITRESLTARAVPGRIALRPEVAARYLLRRGDVLFNRTSETASEVGLASVYLDDEPIVFGGFVIRGRPSSADLDPTYAQYALRAAPVRTQIVGRGQGGIRANIGQHDLKTVHVGLPPRREQRVVARTLSDAASAVGALDRKIVKKERMLQGLAQSLLTGRARLPGFRGAWSIAPAGEVGSFRGGSTFPLRFQGLRDGEIPFFKVSDMNRSNNGVFMNTAGQRISEGQRRRMGAALFDAGCIVFAKVGAAIFLERKRILVGPSCIDNNLAALLVDASVADVRFVHFALTRFRMASLVSTTALPSLNGGQLRSIPLEMPTDINEQRAIAAVLADAGAEVDALRTRLTKAKAIKQGMMQELLTGQTRLPVPDESEVEAP